MSPHHFWETMAEAPQDEVEPAGGAFSAVGMLAQGLSGQAVDSKLQQNSMLKDSLSHSFCTAPWSSLELGRLTHQMSPGTWEVAWEDGDVSVIAKHQVHWLINPKNCSLGPAVVAA